MTKVKTLILVSVLVPLFFKRVSAEFLSMVTLLSVPLLWSGWDIPLIHSLGILMDKLSSALILLSLWMSVLMLLLKPGDNFLNLSITLLLWSLVAFFSVSSFLSFFILFEASLIPTLCLIMGWGYQPERLEASYYFVFYTITLSIPLLISLLWLSSVSGGKYFYSDSTHLVLGGTLSLLMLSVFLIKLPLFMVHFWLPKAHVEAPLVGSMILAGVLLKTGGYGIVRVFQYMENSLVSTSSSALASIGMVAACLACLHYMDMKQVIAYSSVSHMNFMVVGLMNNSATSYSGGVIMMVSHGLCSSLMFLLADLSYKRCQSRSILINKGFLMVAPPLAMFWGLTVLLNMGIPPSAGSVSEILVILSSTKSLALGFMFISYLFLSAFYSMQLYTMINHGKTTLILNSVEVKEIFVVLGHLIPLSGLPLLMDLMLM